MILNIFSEKKKKDQLILFMVLARLNLERKLILIELIALITQRHYN